MTGSAAGEARGRELASTWRVMRAIVADRPVADDDARTAGELLRRHGLSPLAYVGGAPACRADYVQSVFQADRRRRLLAEIADTLAPLGVHATVFKGASYAVELYPDPALRPMGDVDILVPARARPEVLRALIAIGFRDGTRGGGTAVHHAWQLYRGQESIDVHRDVVQPWRSRIDVDAVLERSRPLARVPGLRRLDDVDELIFHWAHLGRSELFAPLIAYVDATRLEARLPASAWRVLWTRVEDYRIRRVAVAARTVTRAVVQGLARPRYPAWGRIQIGVHELIAGRLPPRPIQLARKAVLNDGLSQLAGLAAVFATRRAISALERRR